MLVLDKTFSTQGSF